MLIFKQAKTDDRTMLDPFEVVGVKEIERKSRRASGGAQAALLIEMRSARLYLVADEDRDGIMRIFTARAAAAAQAEATA